MSLVVHAVHKSGRWIALFPSPSAVDIPVLVRVVVVAREIGHDAALPLQGSISKWSVKDFLDTSMPEVPEVPEVPKVPKVGKA